MTYYLGNNEDLIKEELEIRDYYTEKNVFWVPELARWKILQDNAKLPIGTEITINNGKTTRYKITSVGRLIDDALDAIEKENSKLKGVLNKTYASLQLDAIKLEGDPRWRYGTPPKNNANFAWMQHMLYHLAPNGSMALLLANGSMSSNTNNEGQIRKNLLENDLVECMVALPGQLFTNTQIPACIWFLTKNKKARNGFRDRCGEVLFIDARNMGYMKDRVLRDFKPEDIRNIADTYHAWQTNPPQSPFAKGGSEKPQPVPLLKKGGQGGFIKTFLVSANPHHSMRSNNTTTSSPPDAT